MTNDGSVIESDYYHNYTPGNERHRIKFTTMATPLDLSHPVAGNREFGIYSVPSVPNEYTFYTMGVDRINDWAFALGNSLFDGFKDADNLWMSLQNKMKEFINSHGGQATQYSIPSIKARPKWDDVKEYLRGEIDFQTLKQRLGC